ncbi:MAG: hypothetical protein C4345_10120, partial [Chloroflexota bacterium]
MAIAHLDQGGYDRASPNGGARSDLLSYRAGERLAHTVSSPGDGALSRRGAAVGERYMDISGATTMPRGNGPRQRREGQATVEFALVSLLFFAIVFGTVDFGRAIFLKSQLENAVRDAAREGKVGFTNGTSGMSLARLQDHVRNAWNSETQQASPRPGLENTIVTVACTGS